MGRKPGIFQPLIYLDLFGRPMADPKPRRVQETVVCAECGKGFETTRARGRPVKFCSDPCRVRHQREQQRGWQPRDGPVGCLECGAPLPSRPDGPGRNRQFCDARCRKRHIKPMPDPGPDLQLFQTRNERKIP